MTDLLMLTPLLYPDNSPFIPVPLIAKLQSLSPDSRLQVFSGTRHGLPFSHADECAQTLWDFLVTLRKTSSQLNIPSRLFGRKKRGEGIQSVFGDRRAHACHQFLVVVQIVPGKQHGSEDFFGHHQVMDVSA